MSKERKAKFAKLALADEERVTAGHAHHRTPTWSRDGRHLAFAVGQHDDSAWVVTDRKGRVARTIEGPTDGAASFGPDGSIAVERRFGACSEVWLTPGGDLPPVRLLGGDGAVYRDPAISPDGTTLACATASDPHAQARLILVSLQSGSRINVTNGRLVDRHPVFTPDGTELLFEGSSGADHAVYVAHLVHNTITRLTSAEERARRPTVIDQHLVVYERHGDDGHVQLCLLERGSDGQTIRSQPISDDGVSRAEPACFCGKTGVRIAYAAQLARTDGEPPRFDVFVARLRGVTSCLPTSREGRPVDGGKR